MSDTAVVLDYPWLRDIAGPQLAEDPEIRRAGQTFSGTVGFGIDGRTVGLGFHAGTLIAVERRPGPQGATFTIRASGPVWDAVLGASRNLFLRHFHAGEVQVEGDLIEFLRLTEFVLLIVDRLRGAP